MRICQHKVHLQPSFFPGGRRNKVILTSHQGGHTMSLIELSSQAYYAIFTLIDLYRKSLATEIIDSSLFVHALS